MQIHFFLMLNPVIGLQSALPLQSKKIYNVVNNRRNKKTIF